MSIVIRAENISKMYQIGEYSTGTISSDVHRWWVKFRGGEDPYLKIGETNDRTRTGNSNLVWSLKDINFDIKQGSAVGIIGRNGAGKSTLLKILSRVTTPTSGCIKLKGRVASLLEVGTGFHPELSGRDNIFLNGAILGMRKQEISKKFDEIVEFSGVQKYIDTPVKRYSSGMYVRLAFAVAAHLESEILIVDEVLAVGDAEFQKKCLGRMKDASSHEGRTVLFVSHNISAINSLTSECIYLKNGRMEAMGATTEVIGLYQNSGDNALGNNLAFTKEVSNTFAPIEMITAQLEVERQKDLKVFITYVVRRKIDSVVSIKITNLEGVPMLTLRDTDTDPQRFVKMPGNYSTEFLVPIEQFAPNIYLVTFSFSDMKSERFDYYEDLLSFEIDRVSQAITFGSKREGVLFPNALSRTKTIENEKHRL